jgi:hypothetical protein
MIALDPFGKNGYESVDDFPLDLCQRRFKRKLFIALEGLGVHMV